MSALTLTAADRPAKIWTRSHPGRGIRGRRQHAVVAQGGKHGPAFPQTLSLHPGPAEAAAEMRRLIAEGGYVQANRYR